MKSRSCKHLKMNNKKCRVVTKNDVCHIHKEGLTCSVCLETKHFKEKTCLNKCRYRICTICNRTMNNDNYKSKCVICGYVNLKIDYNIVYEKDEIISIVNGLLYTIAEVPTSIEKKYYAGLLFDFFIHNDTANTFMHKYDAFKQSVQNKLIEFRDEWDLSIGYYLSLFGTEMP